MKLFIDSSVFLKLLLDEPGADRAQEILGDDRSLHGYRLLRQWFSRKYPSS